MKSINQIEKSRDLCANYKAYTPPYMLSQYSLRFKDMRELTYATKRQPFKYAHSLDG